MAQPMLRGGTPQLFTAHARHKMPEALMKSPRASLKLGGTGKQRPAPSLWALALRNRLAFAPHYGLLLLSQLSRYVHLWAAYSKSIMKHLLAPVFTHPWLTGAAVLCTSEVLFYFWFQKRLRRLAGLPEKHEEVNDGYQSFTHVLEFIALFTGRPALATKLRTYLSTWFLGAAWEDLKRGNLEEHLAYSFFYKSPDAVRAAGQGPLLQSMLDQLTDRCDLTDVPDGYNDTVKAMWHLNEPLRVQYRPLTFYLLMEGVAGLTNSIMWCLGFKKDSANGSSYWHYGMPPKGNWQPRRRAAVTPSQPTTATPTPAGNKGAGLVGKNGYNGSSVPQSAAFAPRHMAAARPGHKSWGHLSYAETDRGATDPGVPRLPGVSLPNSPATVGRPLTSGMRGSSCPTFQELVACAQAVTQADAERDATQMARQQEANGDVHQQLPMVFLHGVGIGLIAYIPIVWRLLLGAKKQGRPLLVAEFKHVSLRLCSSVPTADTAATAVVAALEQLGLTQACVIAHSYGTFVASRLTQMYPHRVKGLVLVDPVCFGMFLPHLLFNFVYNDKKRTDSLWHWIKDTAVRFAAKELHCAATFCRRFYWHQVQLDPSQLPPQSLVILGGRDELLHGEEVAYAVAALAVARQGTGAHSPFPLASPTRMLPPPPPQSVTSLSSPTKLLSLPPPSPAVGHCARPSRDWGTLFGGGSASSHSSGGQQGPTQAISALLVGASLSGGEQVNGVFPYDQALGAFGNVVPNQALGGALGSVASPGRALGGFGSVMPGQISASCSNLSLGEIITSHIDGASSVSVDATVLCTRSALLETTTTTTQQCDSPDSTSAQPDGTAAHDKGATDHTNGPHSNGSAAHSNGSAAHSNGSAAHSNGSAAHSNGSAAHSNGSAAHSNGSAAHSNGSAAHTNGPAKDTNGPTAHPLRVTNDTQDGSTTHTNGGATAHPFRATSDTQGGSTSHSFRITSDTQGNSTAPASRNTTASGATGFDSPPRPATTRAATRPAITAPPPTLPPVLGPDGPAVLEVGGAPMGAGCKGPGTKLLYHRRMAHADFMFQWGLQGKVVDEVLDFAGSLQKCVRPCCVQQHSPVKPGSMQRSPNGHV